MGDFVKASTDPGNILAALFVIGSTAVAGPAGFLASSAAVFGASAKIKGAGAQQVEIDLAKRQEKLAATDREVTRRRRLNAVLGAQAAQAAASGVGFSGSVANVSIADAEQASIDRLVDRSNTRVTIRTLNSRRSNIGRAGVLSAAGDILSTGATVAQGVRISKNRNTTRPTASGGSGKPGK